MTEPFADGGSLEELQRAYLAQLPERLDELRADIAAFRAARPEAAQSLRTRFHALAGSGGSSGFPGISEIAREMEQWLAQRPAPGEAPRLEHAVERLTVLFRQAQARLGVGSAPAAGHRRRARVVLPPSAEAERLIASLEEAGYAVARGHYREDPLHVTHAERPDLLIVGTAAGEGDSSAIASGWTGRGPRPRAVVLVETLRAVDRLRAVASGVDAVVPFETMNEILPRYARVLARVGPPPSAVLLADGDAARAAATAEVLEAASVRVVRCALAQAVQELLEREVPDLLLLATRLPDGEGVTAAGVVRNDARFQLLPIVFTGPDEVIDRLAALRAGAEDYLPHGVPPELLLATVVARAERGRRVRELLHRDPLTGLLNQASLLTELEHAVEYGRRHGDALAVAVFDLDRFHQVNERYGHGVGDQVLRHVANVFRANVRASDVIGRLGGEEFAMILRGVGESGAAVLAAKLRRVLGEQAATTADGSSIPLSISVGTACFPAVGGGAGELVHAAVRAMRQEKSGKA